MLGADFTDGAPQAPAPSSTPLVVAAGLLWLAYCAGKAAGAKSTAPVPSVGSMLGGYLGLRAMNAIFGGDK